VPWGQRGWIEAGAHTLYAAVVNISEGGLYVLTHAPLSRGTRAKVRIPVGGAQELEANARVVWESSDGGPAGMGLCFTDLDDPERDRLRAFLADRDGM